jgi:6-phosphofructokinase 2
MLTVTLNPALDVCAHVAALEPDRKLHCSDVSVEPGGGGVNVARVAVRLGAEVTALALLSPRSADEFERMLAAEHVPLVAVPGSGDVRHSFTVVEAATGRQYRFVLPGPYSDGDAFQAARDAIMRHGAAASCVVLSGSAPPGVSGEELAALVAPLRHRGTDVIVDVPGQLLAPIATVGATVIKPSVNELSQFAGTPLESHAAIDAAARRLLGLGPNTAVVVSLGAGGALVVPAGGRSTWLHAPRVRPLSTVGAGDSLVAGIAVALQRGQPLVEAARVGVAAGTAATLVPGTGLAQRRDIERLLPEVLVSELG